MNVLPLEKQTQIIAGLTEGLSLRSVSRMFDVERNTIGRLALRVGDGCERLHDRMMRDLNVAIVECDEQWDYIAKKQKRVRPGDPSEVGDVWLHVALSATHKAVISYVVGKRDGTYTQGLAEICERGFSIARRSPQTATPLTSGPSKRLSERTLISRPSLRSTLAIQICLTRRIATRRVTSLAWNGL